MQLLHKNNLVTYFTHFSLLACIASSIRGDQIYQVSSFRMNVFSLRTRLSPLITYFLVIFSSQVNGSLSSSCAKLGPTEPWKLAHGCDQVIRTHGSSNKEFVLSSTCQPKILSTSWFTQYSPTSNQFAKHHPTEPLKLARS